MACDDCDTTSSTTTTAPIGANCCLRVRYTCQLVGGVSTWVLDTDNTECVANGLCNPFSETCSGDEFTFEQQNACVCADPLPALPVPYCAAECGPTTTTTTTSTTTTTTTTTSTTTTSTTTTTTTTSTTTTAAPISCVACSGYSSNVTGAGAGGAGGAGFNAAFVFLGYSDPCQWNWGIARGISLTRNITTGVWTMTAINLIGQSCYSQTFASGAIPCGGLSGAYVLPSTGIDPTCTGSLTVTFP